MKFSAHVAKQRILMIIGLAIMSGTLYRVYFTEDVKWVWEGIIGLTIGLIVFIMDSAVIKPILSVVRGIMKSKTNGGNQ